MHTRPEEASLVPVVVSAFAVAAVPAVAVAQGTPPNPVVTGPITGGLHDTPWFAAPFDVSQYGYSEQEYFFAGIAQAYGTMASAAAYETGWSHAC